MVFLSTRPAQDLRQCCVGGTLNAGYGGIGGCALPFLAERSVCRRRVRNQPVPMCMLAGSKRVQDEHTNLSKVQKLTSIVVSKTSSTDQLSRLVTSHASSLSHRHALPSQGHLPEVRYLPNCAYPKAR
ncbi:hypothetical protein LIA77_04978 [Sarocladium implicatum]|nr:hypothetical protein LIA77_04978 [Sarocladium implicatum]